MKKFILVFSILIAFVGVMVAAGHETIVDIAVGNENFSTLVTALQEADLVEALQGEGPFTVFAPTNDAFAKLPEGTLEALLADKEALTNVLLYHVVAGEYKSDQVVARAYFTTLEGSDLPVAIECEGEMIGNAKLIGADIMAANGVIHVIDTVLLPPEKLDIVDIAVGSGLTNVLAQAVAAAGLVEALQGEGPFTVFAPTDEAFNSLPAGTVEALLADPAALAEVLLYHVVAGEYKAEDVLMKKTLPSLQGQDLDIRLMEGMAYVDNAKIIATDIVAENGVIHLIDSVILPETRTIPEIAADAGIFNTLVAAVVAAGLDEALMGEGPFTVFAPTDEAFAKLPAGTVEALLDDIDTLTNILLYHVVAGEVRARDVINLREAEMLNGSTAKIMVGDNVMIDNAVVIMTDIEAANGIIHVIDSVIIPE